MRGIIPLEPLGATKVMPVAYEDKIEAEDRETLTCKAENKNKKMSQLDWFPLYLDLEATLLCASHLHAPLCWMHKHRLWPCGSRKTAGSITPPSFLYELFRSGLASTELHKDDLYLCFTEDIACAGSLAWIIIIIDDNNNNNKLASKKGNVARERAGSHMTIHKACCESSSAPIFDHLTSTDASSPHEFYENLLTSPSRLCCLFLHSPVIISTSLN